MEAFLTQTSSVGESLAESSGSGIACGFARAPRICENDRSPRPDESVMSAIAPSPAL